MTKNNKKLTTNNMLSKILIQQFTLIFNGININPIATWFYQAYISFCNNLLWEETGRIYAVLQKNYLPRDRTV